MSTSGVCIYDISLNKVLKWDKISTKYGTIKSSSEEEKICYIVDSILGLAHKMNASLIVVEDQFVGHITSKKTAMLLSRLRGALIYGCTKEGLKLESINCNSIKKEICSIANVSGCDKESVANAVISLFSNDSYIQSIGPYSDSQSKAKTSDIYDSIAISVVYAKRLHSN